jgi:molybdopterin-guanine dinucleotide biosynthesis protein A
MRTAGVILVGGQSKRMGRSKAELPFGPETMLERIVELVQPAVDRVLIVAGVGQELPAIPSKTRLVRDEVYDRGPLGGLAAALTSVADDAEAVFVTACDSPFLKAGLATRLFELLGSHSISIPWTGDRLHPLTAVYRCTILPTVRSQLAHDKLRMIDLIPLLPTRRVTQAELADVDATLLSLRNVNTPEEYQSALRDAGFGTG